MRKQLAIPAFSRPRIQHPRSRLERRSHLGNPCISCIRTEVRNVIHDGDVIPGLAGPHLCCKRQELTSQSRIKTWKSANDLPNKYWQRPLSAHSNDPYCILLATTAKSEQISFRNTLSTRIIRYRPSDSNPVIAKYGFLTRATSANPCRNIVLITL